MPSRSHLLIISAAGHGPRSTPGVHADARGWSRQSPVLLGSTPNVIECTHGAATTRGISQAVRRLQIAVKPGDDVSIVVLAHGAATRTGARGLRTEDDQTVALDSLVAGLPETCSFTWYLELCGAVGPHRLDSVFRPSDLVYAACRNGEKAEQRVIDGQWRGGWSFAMLRAIEQATGLDSKGTPVLSISPSQLSERVAWVLKGLDLHQQAQVTGPVARLSSPIHGRHAVSTSARRAMEFEVDWIIVDPSNGDAWAAGEKIGGGNVRIRYRTGEVASNMPDDVTLEWRAPTTGEIGQLGGTWTDTDSSFATGSYPSGGRQYLSSKRTSVVIFKNDFTKVTYMTEDNQLNASNKLKKWAGDEAMSRITAAPSAPSGGWYKAADAQ